MCERIAGRPGGQIERAGSELNHSGAIELESFPGEGTRFTVRLPVDNSETIDQQQTSPSNMGTTSP